MNDNPQTSKSVWLTRHQAETQRICRRYQFRDHAWSWTRLILFLAIPASWYFCGRHHVLAGILSAGFLVAFALAIREHLHIRSQYGFQTRLLLMIQEARRRQGPAATTTALQILDREGYPAALLESARNWLKRSSPNPF